LMLGVDLSCDGAPIVQEALRRGVLINCTHDHILRLLPPFIIRKRDIAEFLTKLEAVLIATSKAAADASAEEHKSKTSIQTQPKAMAASRHL
jgi:acetylornithine/succinyldiaminopimelate/putrescine aminotransferase